MVLAGHCREFCNHCLTVSADVRRCTGCKRVAYCSAECQSADWNGQGMHQVLCGRNSSIRPRAVGSSAYAELAQAYGSLANHAHAVGQDSTRIGEFSWTRMREGVDFLTSGGEKLISLVTKQNWTYYVEQEIDIVPLNAAREALEQLEDYRRNDFPLQNEIVRRADQIVPRNVSNEALGRYRTLMCHFIEAFASFLDGLLGALSESLRSTFAKPIEMLRMLLHELLSCKAILSSADAVSNTVLWLAEKTGSFAAKYILEPFSELYSQTLGWCATTLSNTLFHSFTTGIEFAGTSLTAMQEKASQVALYALFVDSELTARRQKAGFSNDDDLSDSFLQRLGDFVSSFAESLVPTSAAQLYDIFKAMPFLKPFLELGSSFVASAVSIVRRALSLLMRFVGSVSRLIVDILTAFTLGPAKMVLFRIATLYRSHVAPELGRQSSFAEVVREAETFQQAVSPTHPLKSLLDQAVAQFKPLADRAPVEMERAKQLLRSKPTWKHRAWSILGQLTPTLVHDRNPQFSAWMLLDEFETPFFTDLTTAFWRLDRAMTLLQADRNDEQFEEEPGTEETRPEEEEEEEDEESTYDALIGANGERGRSPRRPGHQAALDELERLRSHGITKRSLSREAEARKTREAEAKMAAQSGLSSGVPAACRRHTASLCSKLCSASGLFLLAAAILYLFLGSYSNLITECNRQGNKANEGIQILQKQLEECHGIAGNALVEVDACNLQYSLAANNLNVCNGIVQAVENGDMSVYQLPWINKLTGDFNNDRMSQSIRIYKEYEKQFQHLSEDEKARQVAREIISSNDPTNPAIPESQHVDITYFMAKGAVAQEPFREEILKHLNSLDDAQKEKHPWFIYSLNLVTTHYAALKSDPDYRNSLSDEEVKFVNTNKAVTARAIGATMPLSDSVLSMAARDPLMVAWRNIKLAAAVVHGVSKCDILPNSTKEVYANYIQPVTLPFTEYLSNATAASRNALAEQAKNFVPEWTEQYAYKGIGFTNLLSGWDSLGWAELFFAFLALFAVLTIAKRAFSGGILSARFQLWTAAAVSAIVGDIFIANAQQLAASAAGPALGVAATGGRYVARGFLWGLSYIPGLEMISTAGLTAIEATSLFGKILPLLPPHSLTILLGSVAGWLNKDIDGFHLVNLFKRIKQEEPAEEEEEDEEEEEEPRVAFKDIAKRPFQNNQLVAETSVGRKARENKNNIRLVKPTITVEKGGVQIKNLHIHMASPVTPIDYTTVADSIFNPDSAENVAFAETKLVSAAVTTRPPGERVRVHQAPSGRYIKK